MPSTSSLVTSRVWRGADEPAVFHHRHSVGEVEHVVDVVADEEDADPLLLELDDEFGDLLRLLRPERGRRLIHDQHVGVEVDRPRDGNGLTLPARERAHRLLEFGEMRIEAGHHPARLGFHGDVVERAPGAPELAPQEQVGRGVEILGERQGLIDRLDAVAPGVAGAVDRSRPAVDADLARVGPIGAREHLDQRRLAGTVVAQQADDLAAAKIERHVVDRAHATEADAHAAHLDQRGLSVVHAALPFNVRER